MRYCIFLILVGVLFIATACEDPGGVTVEDKPLGQTVTINAPGSIAILTIATTFKIGFSSVQVTLYNKTDEPIVPTLGQYTYCYLITIMDADSNIMETRDFGLNDFEKQFTKMPLQPGLADNDYVAIYPWSSINELLGGLVRVDVWLSKASDPSKVYHHWGIARMKSL